MRDILDDGHAFKSKTSLLLIYTPERGAYRRDFQNKKKASIYLKYIIKYYLKYSYLLPLLLVLPTQRSQGPPHPDGYLFLENPLDN